MAAAKQLRCLVTGGASGLGRATIQRLIQKHGAKAVILDLPSSNGEKVADEIGKDCYFCPTDVSAWLRWWGFNRVKTYLIWTRFVIGFPRQ